MFVDRTGVLEFLLGDPAKDVSLVSYTKRQNAFIGAYAGAFLTLLGILYMVGAVIRASVEFSSVKFSSYLVLAATSLVMMGLSWEYLLGRTTSRFFSFYLIAYLWVLAIYGTVNTLVDFADGEQIVTFLIYMVIANIIFATPPIGVLMTVIVCYVAMYFLGFSGGRLDSGSLVNFWMSGVTIMMAGFVRYRECRIGARREHELELLGHSDALTGLRNRTALRTDFESLVGRDQYVVMADLDDFKSINDTYGHEAGDIVLATYGRALRDVFGTATLYRYGGDEFLLFVPASSVASMGEMIDAVRARIASINAAGHVIAANTSAGWTQGVASDVLELRNQIHVADERLYEHKRARKEGRV